MEGDGDRVGEGAERHCYSTDKLSHNTCFDPQQHLSPLAFTTKIKKIKKKWRRTIQQPHNLVNGTRKFSALLHVCPSSPKGSLLPLASLLFHRSCQSINRVIIVITIRITSKNNDVPWPESLFIRRYGL